MHESPEMIEFCRFSSLNETGNFTTLLDQENIYYRIEDKSTISGMPGIIPDFNIKPIILYLGGDDFDKANELLNSSDDEEKRFLNQKDLLRTLSDEDIVSIINEQKEWTKEEYDSALQIARERGINLTKPVADLADDMPALYITVPKYGYRVIFLMVIISVLNAFFAFTHQQIFLKLGFGFNLLAENLFPAKITVLMVSLSFSLIMAALGFMVLRQKIWAYISAAVLIFADSLLFLRFDLYYAMLFHLCCLAFVLYAFSRLINWPPGDEDI